MIDLTRKLEQSVQAVRNKWAGTPAVGIVLGSGFGGLSEAIEADVTFESGDIPHYPKPTALGHRGRFLCGTVNGVTVAVMDGRCHLYEGYTPQQIVLPVQLMLQLGAGTVVISNASGAVNPEYRAGDVVLIEDHINMMWKNPLIGENDESLGPRFPDMSCPYDVALATAGRAGAERAGFEVHSGVYLGLTGPNYETPAEYRMARTLGADLVGMSTIPEVLAARHAGARVFAATVVSNVPSANGGPVSGQQVVDVVQQAGPVMRAVVSGVLEQVRSEQAVAVATGPE